LSPTTTPYNIRLYNEQPKPTTEYKTTKSWNPFVGCGFDCTYCKPSFGALLKWVGGMQHCPKCQQYLPHEHPERLSRIPSDKAIFVCEDGDISFAKPDYMAKVFHAISDPKFAGRTWFVQSKNPRCLEQYLGLIPRNTYLVTTLETNRDQGYGEISKAPLPSIRFKDFSNLKWEKKIVTVEPIMDFDLEILRDWIESISPAAVFIGYNSKPNQVSIPEPDKMKILSLINDLEKSGIRVLTKEMRDSRFVKNAYRDFIE
jgi:hypothetical protein